jgi:hypothetical protein
MRLLNVPARLATAGLVALAALDVVLVGTALRSTRYGAIDAASISSVASDPKNAADGTGPADSIAKSVTASPTSGPSATANPTAPATASPTATPDQPTPLQIMLVAIDDHLAWRVHAGSCGSGGATLATTSDGGKTWAGAETSMRSIVRVRPSDGRTAFVVGAGSSCEADLRSTIDRGGTWGSTSTVGSAWFRDPKNLTVVNAPGASTAQPCGERAVLDLAVVSHSTARVLCADGRVRSTTNTASSWTDVGQVTGAVTLAVRSASPAQTYVARLGAPDCAGVMVQRVDQTGATSCVETTVPDNPGQISLSLVSGGGWLAVGDTTMRSTDDLATWSVS